MEIEVLHQRQQQGQVAATVAENRDGDQRQRRVDPA